MAKKEERRPWGAALVALAVIAAAIIAFKASGLQLRELHDIIGEWGPWGPVVWALILWLTLPLMAPVSVMSALAGLAFGPEKGFLSAYVGVVGGGLLIFWISRLAGHQLVDRLLGSYADRLDPHLDAHGLFGTLYLRMLPLPYVPISYMAGLTRLDFLPYAVGTALGIIPGVLVSTVVAGTVGEVWMSDLGWKALFQPRTLWAGLIVIASIVAPFAIEGVRRLLGGAQKSKAMLERGGADDEEPEA